jgi:hypothetical protein
LATPSPRGRPMATASRFSANCAPLVPTTSSPFTSSGPTGRVLGASLTETPRAPHATLGGSCPAVGSKRQAPGVRALGPREGKTGHLYYPSRRERAPTADPVENRRGHSRTGRPTGDGSRFGLRSSRRPEATSCWFTRTARSFAASRMARASTSGCRARFLRMAREFKRDGSLDQVRPATRMCTPCAWMARGTGM